MRTSIRSLTKSCRACQFNKKRKLKYGHLPPKTIITVPCRALCVDLIGPYTLKGKDGTIIDFMALTMIDPTTSWFEIVELPFIRRSKTFAVDGKESSIAEEIFDKTSERIARFSRYPRCCCIIYATGSEFKLNFEYLCVTYGIKRKPTTIKNPQANAFLECLHQALAQMLRTAKIDMAERINPDGVGVFFDNTAWAIHCTYHTVLKASPGARIFDCNMLFNIPFIADWNKIGGYRQRQTNLDTAYTNSKQVDNDYKVGNKVLLTQECILCKAESPYSKKPWTITTVHTNRTIRIQCRTQSERLNIWKVTPFVEE